MYLEHLEEHLPNLAASALEPVDTVDIFRILRADALESINGPARS